jgi:hypothetical protein
VAQAKRFLLASVLLSTSLSNPCRSISLLLPPAQRPKHRTSRPFLFFFFGEPSSPWAVVPQPRPTPVKPCRTSAPPADAPQPHPDTNPSSDHPNDARRRGAPPPPPRALVEILVPAILRRSAAILCIPGRLASLRICPTSLRANPSPCPCASGATACHGRRRPCSPWAAIISPSPLSSTPCRASPLPTGAPRPHPGANPSPDHPTDVHHRPSSTAASASPSTRPSSSSHPLPITLAGPHHLEEAHGPPHRASSTRSMPEHHYRDQARPPLPPGAELHGQPASDHPSSTRTPPEVHLHFFVLLHPWPLVAGDPFHRNAAAFFLHSVPPTKDLIASI